MGGSEAFQRLNSSGAAEKWERSGQLDLNWFLIETNERHPSIAMDDSSDAETGRRKRRRRRGRGRRRKGEKNGRQRRRVLRVGDFIGLMAW